MVSPTYRRKYHGELEDDPYTVEGSEEAPPINQEMPQGENIGSSLEPETPPPMPPPEPPSETKLASVVMPPPPRPAPPKPVAMQRYEQMAATPPPMPKSGVAKNIGQALLSRRMGSENAFRLLHPKVASEQDIYHNQLAGAKTAADAEKARIGTEENISNTEANQTYRKSLEDKNNREATEFSTKQEDTRNAKRAQNDTNRFKAYVGNRKVEYRQSNETPPDGYSKVPVNDPNAPGMVAYVAGTTRRVPKELTYLLPGYKEGDMAPVEELDAAYKAHQRVKEEEEKAPKEPSEFAGAIIAEGGDPRDRKTLTREIMGRALQRMINSRQASQKGPESLMMIPDGQGGYTAKTVRGGDTVPKGAMTPSGASSLEVPTAQTKTMTEAAPKVLALSSRIRQVMEPVLNELGPGPGRWNDFLTGKIGVRNPQYNKVRVDIGLLQTALMRMHMGGRGGEKMMEHFRDLIDMSKSDPDNLKSALEEIELYAQSLIPKNGEGEHGPPPPPPASNYKSLRYDKKTQEEWGLTPDNQWVKTGKKKQGAQ